jgi:hypothetical protein
MANLSASCFMRVAATVKELRRSLFLSRPSAVAPPELLSRRLGNWDLADYFNIARHPSLIGSKPDETFLYPHMWA